MKLYEPDRSAVKNLVGNVGASFQRCMCFQTQAPPFAPWRCLGWNKLRLTVVSLASHTSSF